MRTCRKIMVFMGILAACGDDQSPTTTVTSMTMSTPSGGTEPTGSGDSDDSGGTMSSADETTVPTTSATNPLDPGSPVFLSLQTNVSKITAGESVRFTAVLTDPDGVDDIVGGTLSDQTGMSGYGPFVAAGQEGTYSIELSWDAVHQAEAIQFEGMDLVRVFRAEFYDQSANKVSKDVDMTLACAEGSACDGVCTNIMTDQVHCGACDKACGAGCAVGECIPTWGECITPQSGFDTCDAYCTSVGEMCVENGCQFETTIRAYKALVDCNNEVAVNFAPEPCDLSQSWSLGREVVRCCCTETD